jgi:hypothetical protein
MEMSAILWLMAVSLSAFGKRIAQPKIFFSQACRGEIKMKSGANLQK